MIFVVDTLVDGRAGAPQKVHPDYQTFEGVAELHRMHPDAIYYTDEPRAFEDSTWSKVNALLAAFEKTPFHSVKVSEVVTRLREVLR